MSTKLDESLEFIKNFLKTPEGKKFTEEFMDKNNIKTKGKELRYKWILTPNAGGNGFIVNF